MKHKGKLFTLLATGLLSLGIALSGCAKEPTPGPGPSPSPSPNPSPEPSPGPVEPEVNYVYENLKSPAISGLPTDAVDMTKDLTFSFTKDSHAKSYDIRVDKAEVEEENAQRVDPSDITEDKDNNKIIVTVKAPNEEGNFKVYVKALADTEENQKKDTDTGTVKIYRDALTSTTGEFITVDFQKSEFMEFYNQLHDTLLEVSLIYNANDASINRFYAINIKDNNTLEVFLSTKSKNRDKMEKYEYTSPTPLKANYKDLIEMFKTMDKNAISRTSSFYDENHGNTYGIDCWEKLMTTNLLSEDTTLKQSLNDPSFEKIFAYTGPRSVDFNDVHFYINGLYKIKENGIDKYYYFDERITQPLSLESDGIKLYTNFNEDKNNCKITEVEGRELSPLNADFQAKYDKYVANKTANKMAVREVAQKPVYTVSSTPKTVTGIDYIINNVNKLMAKYKEKEAEMKPRFTAPRPRNRIVRSKEQKTSFLQRIFSK